MTAAYVIGMQGDSLQSNSSVIAEPKHYVGYAAAEGGRNTAPGHLGMREIFTDFLPIFKAAVTEGKAKGIMSAYSEVDGIPNCMNTYLLSDVLRGELGFEGIVISDLGAIHMLEDVHKTAANATDAIRLYLEAGGNMQFYDYPHDVFQNGIVDMVKSGVMKQEVLDLRVADVLHVKELLGLFDNPFTDVKLVPQVVNSQKHQQLALEAAREVIVLLKNDRKILPLPKHLSTILVCGPSASEARLGDYTGVGGSVNNINTISLLQGVKLVTSEQTQVIHRWGTGIQSDNEQHPIHWYNFKQPSSDKPGLLGTYYSNIDFTGDKVERDVPEINFKWTYGFREIPEFPNSTFSVIWTGQLNSKNNLSCNNVVVDITVNGVLALNTDDKGPAKLYVDGKLVIDSKVNNTVPFSFVAGTSHSIRVEFVRLPFPTSHTQTVALLWNLVGNNGIQDAVSAAKDVDAIIIAVGEDTATVGEGLDRTSLNLPGKQHELIQALHETGKPIVLVLMNGRPLSLRWEAENIPGILETYFAGQAQGRAIADVLFGDYNPAGRLPMTVPKDVGQLPLFYNRKPSSVGHGYVEVDGDPLYPFGFGLSYATFDYGDLVISPKEIAINGKVMINATIKNSGHLEGDEVVQLYIRDQIASVTTPVKQLKGISRIHLKASESRTVSFTLNAREDLAVFGHQMKWIVEPGWFDVMIGASSNDIRLKGNFTVSNK
jgi:beta-glucosidase